MAFSFFGKKPPTDAAGKPHEPGDGDGGDEKIKPDPAKARTFFDRAQTVHETENFEYAATLWLQGLRQDPTSMRGHEMFLQAASTFAETTKAKGPSKDQLSAFTGKTAVDKYLQALLHWGVRPMDWQLGVKAFEHAAKLGLEEPGYWMGSKVLGVMMNDPKTKASDLKNMMDLFAKISAYDRAVQAGESAIRKDPSDAQLVNRVRNMSAQATMSKGGYESSGQAGGFRKNVKDIDAQRLREQEESLVKSEDAQVRIIENARKDHEQRPDDPNSLAKYARLLTERGTPEDEKIAYQLYIKGFENTKTYKFKQLAGDIKMRVGRRKLRQYRSELEADPNNPERRAQVEQFTRKLLESEIQEYIERVAAYPTDLNMKYELGRRYFELNDHEKAIEQFQIAQNAPGIAVAVLSYLGQSFQAMGWLDEAEGTYRRAMNAHPVMSDDLGMMLRYGLMDVLQKRAVDQRDLVLAEEAFKLASNIAIEQIGYRDIRARREQLQALLKELRTR